MDTVNLELQTMEAAEDGFRNKNHIAVGWESFLGGAVRILECHTCHRFVLSEVLPNGDDENGNQVYETDIRGSAPTTDCDARKVS
jgi:hypothetical protein